MSLPPLLHRLLQHPAAASLADLDSAEATALHERMLRDKTFLRKLYCAFYEDFAAASRRAPANGLRIEIGAGSGFLPEVLPGVRTLDLRPGARVGLRASALDLPLADSSVSCLFLLDVLHHLPDAAAFLAEALRVLMPDGRLVLIEPYNSIWARVIYKRLHPEPFDETQLGWRLDAGGPMTAANQALPWIILVRDRPRFEAMFPGLVLEDLRPHTILLYLLSGGLSMRALAPGFLFEPLREIETALLARASRQLATMMTAELRKDVNSLARTGMGGVLRSAGGS